MKKGDVAEGFVERMDFPNKGIVRIDTEDGAEYAVVKNALPGCQISFRISKKKHGNIEGRLLEVLSAPEDCEGARCPHARLCGGCLYQGMSYDQQLAVKDGQIRRLLAPVIGEEAYDAADEGILPSPLAEGYRNKMELTFGDNEPGGILQLGMHVRGSFYDIVTTDECRIMDADMRKVLQATLQFFREKDIAYYHKRTHRGYLRHLLLRKAAKTGEILVCLVTSTELTTRSGDESSGIMDDADITCKAMDSVFVGAEAKDRKEEDGSRVRDGGETVPKRVASEREISGCAFSEQTLLAGWCEALRAQSYKGTLVGILHTKNDRPADVVEDQGTEVLYGQDHFTEELLGLSFQITPFSFFQTNSLGAEVLYAKAREYVVGAGGQAHGADNASGATEGENKASDATDTAERAYNVSGDADKAPGVVDMPEGEDHKPGVADITYGRLFDLYSGTGTIAQILSPSAKEVIGVEIVEEAVEAAKANAKENGLANCRFLCGDVLKVIDEIEDKPDMIVLDPPRDGIHPKALPKLLAYGVEHILYISCKPTSLARDLPSFLEAGYEVKRLCKVDMFPMTGGVETVCLLSNRKPDARVKIDVDLEDYYRIKDEQKKNKASE